MTIERLGPFDPISQYNKAEKASKPVRLPGKDSIDLSEEAKSRAELYRLSEKVRMSPDIREDRVAEVKKKLEDPNYIDDRIKGIVADRIIDIFGL